MATQGQLAFTPEFVLAFRDLMVGVLAQEMGPTARVLAAVPDARRDYRPHPDSRSAWELAWHIAADVFFLEGIAALAFQPDPDQRHANPAHTSAELAEWFRTRFGQGLGKVGAMSADQLLTPLSLGVAESAGARFPAFVYLMGALRHLIHHRGQLSAYLRSMGGKVPSIYGASADEPWQQ
jgi:uncharacterized damage-inducible protein DinB